MFDMTNAEKQAKRNDARRRYTEFLDRKIAQRNARQDTAKAPRYDDVFFEGVAWLDSL